MSNITSNIYVVSLRLAAQRRAHIVEQFGKHNIDFKFFDAITKQEVLQVAQNMSLQIEENSLTLGELGCFMSHVSLWQMMVDNELPYLLIFEDDVVLAENAPMVIKNIENLSLKSDILKLETMKEKVLFGTAVDSFQQYQLLKIKSSHMGTAAYVISNKCAQQALTKLRCEQLNKPIDHFMFTDFLQDFAVHQLYPAIAIQEDVLNSDAPCLASVLEAERKARMTEPKQELSLMDKMIRESKRIGKQLSINNFKEKRQLKRKYKDYIIVPFEDE